MRSALRSSAAPQSGFWQTTPGAIPENYTPKKSRFTMAVSCPKSMAEVTIEGRPLGAKETKGTSVGGGADFVVG
eukprot:scaffold90382_cov41-Prasinocladus_malaysianus.AAC.1